MNEIKKKKNNEQQQNLFSQPQSSPDSNEMAEIDMLMDNVSINENQKTPITHHFMPYCN